MDLLIDHHSAEAKARDQEIEDRVIREIEDDMARGRTFRTMPPAPRPVNTMSRPEYRKTNVRTIYVDGMPKEAYDLERVR